MRKLCQYAIFREREKRNITEIKEIKLRYEGNEIKLLRNSEVYKLNTDGIDCTDAPHIL